jgi:hypothetical protein
MRLIAYATPFQGKMPLQAYATFAVPAFGPVDWFTDIANSISGSLMNARLEIVKNLVKTSLPSVEELRNSWFLTALGGTYGLANLLVTTVVIIVGFTMIVTPTRNHSVRISRTFTSMIYVAVFGLVFFRVYSLAYNLVQALTQGLINMALGKETASYNEAVNLIATSTLPGDVWLKLLVSALAWFLSYMVYIVAYINVIMVFLIGIFYIIPLVLRPLHEKLNSLFHLFNSGLITTLVTPMIIVIGLMLPFVTEKYLPFGATSVGSGIAIIVGTVIALFGPVLFAMWAFGKSHEIFGAVDSNIAGSVNINSMPTVRTEMDQSVRESATKSFVTTFGVGAATANLSQSDNLTGDLRSLAVEAGAAAATASGYPLVGAALSAVDTTLTKEKRIHTTEAQQDAQYLPPPSGSPVAEMQEASATPPPPPPTPSPIIENPGKNQQFT